MNLQVEPQHYYKNYDSKKRFCSYWHQINEITSHNPLSILEIGIGNGFVSKYLTQNGFNVVTLDLDRELFPDIVSSILNIPFSEKSFEIVACYEVLEHLPYFYFKKALIELYRVSSSFVIISIPDSNTAYRLYIQIPKFGLFKKIVEIPKIKKINHHFDGQHYWEIGKANYSLEIISNTINEVGFKIEKTYRVFEMPYHRFFVLRR